MICEFRVAGSRPATQLQAANNGAAEAGWPSHGSQLRHAGLAVHRVCANDGAKGKFRNPRRLLLVALFVSSPLCFIISFIQQIGPPPLG